MVTPNLTGTEVKLILMEKKISQIVFQESSFRIKMRILKTRILDTDFFFFFAFCKGKKKVYSIYQMFSESSKTSAVIPHLNLRALQADTGLK